MNINEFLSHKSEYQGSSVDTVFEKLRENMFKEKVSNPIKTIIITHRWKSNFNMTLGTSILSFDGRGVARVPEVGSIRDDLAALKRKYPGQYEFTLEQNTNKKPKVKKISDDMAKPVEEIQVIKKVDIDKPVEIPQQVKISEPTKSISEPVKVFSPIKISEPIVPVAEVKSASSDDELIDSLNEITKEEKPKPRKRRGRPRKK